MAVYVMNCSKGFVKIGKSIVVEGRRRSLNNGEYGEVTLVHAHECNPSENHRIEGLAHELLRNYHIKDEIFSCSPEQAVLAVTRAAEIASSDPSAKRPVKDVKINIVLRPEEYRLFDDMWHEYRYRSMGTMVRELLFESIARRGWKVEDPEWFTKNVIPKEDSVGPETTIDQ